MLYLTSDLYDLLMLNFVCFVLGLVSPVTKAVCFRNVVSEWFVRTDDDVKVDEWTKMKLSV